MILITGHTKGIGAALCEKLLTAKETIIGVARTTVAANDRLTQLQLDLSKQPEIAKCCKAIREYNIRAIVLNAGFNTIRPAESYSVEEIFEIINANFVAHAALIKTCLPSLIKNKGKIIAIGSMSGVEVAKWNNYYGASKAALHHLIQNIFEQYRKQGVQCTTIIPDITNSSFYEKQDFEPTMDIETYIEPTEIADVIKQLLDNKTTTVTTQIVIRPQKFGLNRKS